MMKKNGNNGHHECRKPPYLSHIKRKIHNKTTAIFPTENHLWKYDAGMENDVVAKKPQYLVSLNIPTIFPNRS